MYSLSVSFEGLMIDVCQEFKNMILKFFGNMFPFPMSLNDEVANYLKKSIEISLRLCFVHPCESKVAPALNFYAYF